MSPVEMNAAGRGYGLHQLRLHEDTNTPIIHEISLPSYWPYITALDYEVAAGINPCTIATPHGAQLAILERDERSYLSTEALQYGDYGPPPLTLPEFTLSATAEHAAHAQRLSQGATLINAEPDGQLSNDDGARLLMQHAGVLEEEDTSISMTGYNLVPPLAHVRRHAYSSKEMLYMEAALQPLQSNCATMLDNHHHHFHVEEHHHQSSCPKSCCKTLRTSSNPQSVAARQRRSRIREKLWDLRSLVPGTATMDTASMLEEAIQYLKFLKAEVEATENPVRQLPL